MKNILLFFIIIGFSCEYLLGQELKSTQNNFGLGVALFNLPEYLYESSSGNSIYLTIDMKNNFRLEPTVGFSFSKSLRKYFFGLGVFKQKEISNFKLLSGVRIGLQYGNIFVFAPTVGGEYYFNDHFSFGSEIQLRGSIDSGIFTIMSNSSVIVRFYF